MGAATTETALVILAGLGLLVAVAMVTTMIAINAFLAERDRRRAEGRELGGRVVAAIVAGHPTPVPPLEQVRRFAAHDAILEAFDGLDDDQRLSALAWLEGADCLTHDHRLLLDHRPLIRAGAVRRLAITGRPEDADAMRRALDDPSPIVRGDATIALARIAGGDAVADRILRLYVDGGISEEIVLASLGNPAAPCFAALRSRADDPDPRLRGIACMCLTRSADPDVAPLLLSLAGDPVPELRRQGVLLLVVAGQPVAQSAIAPAVTAMARADEPYVRSAASTAAAALLEATPARRVLAELERDPALPVRLRAREARDLLGDPDQLRLAAIEQLAGGIGWARSPDAAVFGAVDDEYRPVGGIAT